MKTLLFLVILLSTTALASEVRNDPFPDQDISCVVTSDEKRYQDVFLVQVRALGYSRLSYTRIHLASPRDENGNLTYGAWEPVRGCHQGVQTKVDDRPELLNIEFGNDGQEGMITLSPASSGKSFTGEIYFYMPQIGYPERTLLEVSCVKN